MPYAYRLLCLSFASFFLIQLLAGLVVKLFEGPAIRRAERMSASLATRLLFTIRLLPPSLAAMLVAVLCVPSYLWLEPRTWSEPVGAWCSVAALLGGALWTLSLSRALRALTRSIRFERSCRPFPLEVQFPGEPATIWVVRSASPVIALAGIVRPKLLVSREALRTLSLEELQSVVAHERAHQHSRDNLKRLALLLAPDILPFWRAFSNYDHAWARITEWAADDHAAARSPERTLSLAAALVRVARLNAAAMAAPLITSFLSEHSGLSARVDRLLTASEKSKPRCSRTAAPAMMAVAVLAALLAAQPATLRFVHQLLEHLIR